MSFPNNKVKIVVRRRFSRLFFLFVAALLQQILFFSAFASNEILQVDTVAKNSKEIIEDIFYNTYQENVLQPNIPIQDLAGADATLKEFRGNFVILYFWAQWCNTCTQEMQSMVKMLDKLEFMDIKDVKILPVSVDFKDSQSIADFYSSKKLQKLPMLRDGNKRLMNALKVKSLPTTFFINKQGYIIQGFENNLNWDDENLIKALVDIKGESAVAPHAALPNIDGVKKADDTAPKNNIMPTPAPKKEPTLIF